jgi:hypothetical protein
MRQLAHLQQLVLIADEHGGATLREIAPERIVGPLLIAGTHGSCARRRPRAREGPDAGSCCGRVAAATCTRGVGFALLVGSGR